MWVPLPLAPLQSLLLFIKLQVATSRPQNPIFSLLSPPIDAGSPVLSLMSKARELPPPPPHRPLFKHHSWSPDMLREEIWRRRQSQRPNHSRGGSLSDDDLDELKACIDLGFGFDSVDVDPKLSDTFPALGLYYAVNKRYANSLSRSSSFSSIVSESDDVNPSTIFDSGEDSQTVKTKLKQWAKIVSCSVRQSLI